MALGVAAVDLIVPLSAVVVGIIALVALQSAKRHAVKTTGWPPRPLAPDEYEQAKGAVSRLPLASLKRRALVHQIGETDRAGFAERHHRFETTVVVGVVVVGVLSLVLSLT